MKTVVRKVPAPTTNIMNVQTFKVCDATGVQRVLKCELDQPYLLETWTRAATGNRVIRASDHDGRILYREEGSDFDQMDLIGIMARACHIEEIEEETGDLDA